MSLLKLGSRSSMRRTAVDEIEVKKGRKGIEFGGKGNNTRINYKGVKEEEEDRRDRGKQNRII
jgi:hypothetical protein